MKHVNENGVDRVMTADEIAALQAMQADAAADLAAQVAAADQIAAARASALAKLSALGLSDDEINALVG